MDDELDSHFGLLKYDDGGARGIAAGLVWLGLLQADGITEAELREPRNLAIIRSLLNIPAIYKRQDDPAVMMIKRIIKQNVDAKKLPVSSFEWSEILRSLESSGKGVPLAEAIQVYNDSAEVRAHGGDAERRHMSSNSVH